MGNFFSKPFLRNSEEGHNEHRHVTWLELFYDLAFVVAIASVAHEMSNVTDLKMGALSFVLLFIPVWWAWLGDAFYTNRYDPEDHGHEILTLFQMFGVVGIAIFARQGLENGFTGFVISFIFVRVILAILSFRTGYHLPYSKKLNYFIGKSIVWSLVFWVAALFFAAPISYWLIGIGIIIDVGAPLFNAKEQQRVPVNAEHLSARFGFFFIILLLPRSLHIQCKNFYRCCQELLSVQRILRYL